MGKNRTALAVREGGGVQAAQDPQNRLPPELMRRYDVVFVPRSLQKTLKLREIASKNVGRLVSVQVGPLPERWWGEGRGGGKYFIKCVSFC